MPADFGSVKEIFLAAVEKADPGEREAYLREACGDDGELRRRVEGLLRHHDKSGSMLESPFAHSSAAITEERAADQPPTDDAAAPTEAGGDRVGPYKLVQKLGEGGMGVVWVAEQTEPLKRRVALKVIKPGMDSAHVVRRFEAERQALALMDHPNIARVFDADTTAEGRPYFVMELVRGVPITKYCDELHLTVRERLELFVPVCQAIQHAHTKGVVHRDIKPSNVLVSMQDGRPVPKVIDFGIAKALHQPLTDASLHTAIGQIVGTLEYMSPEQAELSALDVDTRADVYSLGVLLYELLTGTTPLDRKRLRQEYAELVRRIRDEEPPRPSTRLTDSAESLESVAQLRRTEPQRLKKALRGDLDWIVMRCLEKDRTRRYETANGLARDVERHLADEPVEASRPGVGYRLGKFLRRHRAGVLTAAAFVLLLVAATALSAWQAMRATAERDEKEEARREAVESEERAVEAAEAERKAKELADRRLGQIQKANDVLASIFGDLNPDIEKKEGSTLQEHLSERLLQAATHLDGSAIDDPLALAQLQQILGKTLTALNHYRQAIVLLEKARTSLRAKLGPVHERTLTTTNALALAYQGAGKLDTAIPLFEETLGQMKATLGPDEPVTLATTINLADAYQDAGSPGKAIPLFEETLGKQKATLGPDHPRTLATTRQLAVAYQDAGKLGKAIPLLEETLGKMKAKLGPDRLDTLLTMNSLGVAYEDAGKLDKAIPLLEETMGRLKAKLGPDHRRTLATTNNLAVAYLLAGKLGKVIPLLEETLGRLKAKLGPDHPDTLNTMNNLANAYQDAGRPGKAIPLLEETLGKQKATLGPDHPRTLITMNNLAVVYQEAGLPGKAVPLLEETLGRRKAKLGPDHPDTLNTMNNLANAYLAVGQLDKARPLLNQVLEKQKAQLKQVRDQHGRDTALVAPLIAGMGLNLLQQQKYAEADPVLRECLAIREKTQPDVWSTFNTRSHLGWALLGQKKYAEAEPLLVAGYEGMKRREAKIPPGGKARLTEALKRLVELYDKTGEKDKAAAWRKELDAARAAAKKKPAP